jgi:hypothetical protein
LSHAAAYQIFVVGPTRKVKTNIVVALTIRIVAIHRPFECSNERVQINMIPGTWLKLILEISDFPTDKLGLFSKCTAK